MPIYKIRGIDVDFPYEAYDCQIVYMEKVIQSLQQKCNALLESPTGTGKTLCLLCATLAWRRSLGEFSTDRNSCNWGGSSQADGLLSSQKSGELKLPTIVYTTRTHSQLQQVIQELKRTNYRPKMVVIGSREQLCINEDVQVLRGRAQTNACQFLRRKRNCSNYKSLPDFVKNNQSLGDDPIDIEDLVSIGRIQGPCPYYLSRELHKVVDILFAPYNYLIDRGNRKSLTINWHDSVLIFDEAHNLEGICADAASFDLTSGLLTACISEAKKCVDLCVEKRAVEKMNDKSFDPNDFAILRALLLKLEKRIAEVPIESKELGFTRPGPYIFELLAELNITEDTSNMLIDTITNGVTLLEDAENASTSGANKMKGTVFRLETMADILQIIFNGVDQSHARSYRVHVQENETRSLDAFKGKASRTLSWWCFNPGIAMGEFSKIGVGSIILTSGTLSPLDSFAQELKLQFPVRLENPHVISSNQIWAGVVPSGPSGCCFNSSYRNRDSLAYKQELGNAIANFARIVPDGLLVFFPSYYLLDLCIGCWKNMSHSSSTNSSTIWERICKHKQPVIEPKQSSLFNSSIEDFMTKLKDISTSGAVFFAVCRGKVSEGLDFADHTGRAVVITGMPFATWNDPKVRLKRDYLDQLEKNDFKALTGDQWYNQQATRAVNQAVGRVIRHRHDYGAIIFCDERFTAQLYNCSKPIDWNLITEKGDMKACLFSTGCIKGRGQLYKFEQPKNQHQISRWIQPHIKCYSNFGEVVFTLTRFFRDKVTPELVKPDLTKSLRSDNTSDVKISLHQRNFMLEGATTVLTTTDQDCSGSNSCSNLEEILPANRSTLTSLKNGSDKILKHPRDKFGKVNKLGAPVPKSRDPQYQKTAVVDLTSDSEWDEQSNILFSSKKSKILKVDPDVTLYSENQLCLGQLPDTGKGQLPSYPSPKVLEKQCRQSQLAQCSFAKASIDKDNENKRNVQISPVVKLEGNVTSKETALGFPAQKDIPSGSLPRNEESRGSAFLIQVQEKLSATEYREFVDYMKALKTKTMKVAHVLQSIATLFSSPERHFLLKRFKDYIPAKYQPMYEQYLKTYEAAVTS
ncbi:hypothetical protein AQUCO_02000207v1 [Aquilegia coerulea]|uniref:Regulator of telomere elongation helicase 1 homolog n=1 Tax=Aquilegia coerulea TaxID=218851 RepID=A0A2G5DGK4_AQUCA|nr:hypothetical protein AQUCO_02000207v1 [Aquilegia coerulea]